MKSDCLDRIFFFGQPSIERALKHFTFAPLPGLDTRLQGVYRQRNPRKSALFKIVEARYERFEEVYEERFARSYGHFRPVIRDVEPAVPDFQFHPLSKEKHLIVFGCLILYR